MTDETQGEGRDTGPLVVVHDLWSATSKPNELTLFLSIRDHLPDDAGVAHRRPYVGGGPVCQELDRDLAPDIRLNMALVVLPLSLALVATAALTPSISVRLVTKFVQRLTGEQGGESGLPQPVAQHLPLLVAPQLKDHRRSRAQVWQIP